jgi:ribosome-associated protein
VSATGPSPVPVSGEIKLGQFLKLADLVDSGADGKAMIAGGRVFVNDDAETRRGRRLVPGDVVRVAGRSAVVAEG